MTPSPLATISDVLGPFHYEALLRILIAAALGGGIGWERERAGRAAGLRTHMLLCVGCALIMLISLYVPTIFAEQSSATVIRTDPGRIAGHVLSGLGFLGAGAIIVLGRHIRGLTTAACIWVAAAIGLAVGAGYILVAVFAFAVSMFALHVLDRWERRMRFKNRYRRLTLRFEKPGKHLPAAREVLERHGIDLLDCSIEWQDGRHGYELELRHSRPVDAESLTAELRDCLRPEGLSRLEWRR